MRTAAKTPRHLVGEWVGTVLAFYFSKENFESANQNVRAMVSQISARDQLRAISAKEVMIPVGSIIGLKLGDSQTDRDIDLVNGVLSLINYKVTRVPIQAANGAIKYVAHESTLHKYLYNAAAGSPPGLAGLTLEDLVNSALGKLIKAIAVMRCSGICQRKRFVRHRTEPTRAIEIAHLAGRSTRAMVEPGRLI